MPKISRFWLCFPVFILAEGNTIKVVLPITCRHCVIDQSWRERRWDLQRMVKAMHVHLV